MKKLRIGIVGCGAIGSSLAKVILRDFSRNAKLVSLFDLDIKRAQRLSERLAAKTLKQLIDKSELVIESASAKASFDIASLALRNRRDVMVMSVGGLIGHTQELSGLALKNNSRVFIPSGAISGVDALKAAREGRITSVLLTTRKNPKAFKGVKYIQDKRIDLNGIKKDKVLFSGTAQQAVRYFPQNINVAAVLSLAGIGEKRTRVEIIASPLTDKNIHEIRIESKAGNIITRTENILHPDNPKTSFLAVLSAIATLKQILDPVRIGT